MENKTPDAAFRVAATFDVFNPPSVKFAKLAAHRLRKAHYTTTGSALKLSTAQETLARVYGHKDWFTLARQVERDGYLRSKLDCELTVTQLDVRRVQQRDMLMSILDLYAVRAVSLARDAQLTTIPTEVETQSGGGTADITKYRLPLAQPRPGLSEILLTAYPFSVAGNGIALPGWKHYVLVAAPTDNTALWVRFCDEHNIAAETQYLVRTVKSLSASSLAIVYVPSQVRSLVPNLIGGLAAHGVKVSGGRLAILAARLRSRLESVLFFVGMDLGSLEDVPSQEELVATLHNPEGLVELPDSKNLVADKVDPRRFVFCAELLRQIREQRWPHAAKTPQPEKAVEKVRRTEFHRNDDGRINFGSGARRLAKGSPVYRIRLALSLVEDYTKQARRVAITRVIDVPVAYSLWDLHVAIQDAMGWVDYHLHEFSFSASRTGKKVVKVGSPMTSHRTSPSARTKCFGTTFPLSQIALRTTSMTLATDGSMSLR